MKGTRSGFTLIELLVVITIIAVLAAMLFPVFSSARGSAKRAACQSNLKQIVAAALMYADDYAGVAPPPIYYGVRWGEPVVVSGVLLVGWTERIAPYAKSYYRTVGAASPNKGHKTIFSCPEQVHYYSYGIVWWYPPPHTWDRSLSQGLPVSQVVRPTKMVFFYEMRRSYAEDSKNRTWVLNEDSGLSNDNQPDGPQYYKFPGHADTVDAGSCWLSWPGPHNDGHNLAFVDGHVRWFQFWDSSKMTFRADTF